MKSFDAGTLLRLMPCILAACAAGCSAKQEPAVEPINTNDVRWGEVTNGLQMGIVVEPSFGVVQCWLRNGETNEVAYNSWSLGYWECIGLELRDGTNWLRLARSPALRGYEGIGPSIGKVIRLKPGEVIVSQSIWFSFAERRYGPWVTNATETHRNLRPTPAAQVPASRGATFFVDLLDFTWPPAALHQPKREIRVCHYFAPCQESGSFAPGDASYARGSAGFTVYSPVFILDGTAVESLLDQLPDEKGH